jgi:AAA ATPase domain
MRISWFQVEGYKNLRTPARLDALGPLNALHGDNNVGKSNLLESILLLFVGLGAVRDEGEQGPSLDERYARGEPAEDTAPDGRPPRRAVRSFHWFASRGMSPDDIFDRSDARPITLQASLSVDPREGDPDWMRAPIEVALRLTRGDEEVAVEVVRLSRADGADLAGGGGEAAVMDQAFSLALARLVKRSRGREIVPRFALIRADRTIATGDTAEGAPLAAREPLPQELARALHDAEVATDGRQARFQRFIASLEAFRPIVGPGQWRMRYDRATDRAELWLDSGGEHIPLRLMGSGVQQLAALLAHLLMTGADIVAVEEPELNLRWTAQRVLRDVLHQIVGGGEGPSQILLASHSGQFEDQTPVYFLTRAEGGARVHKQSAAEARLFLHPEGPPPPPGFHGVPGYVTTEGLVEVPPFVREGLGLASGGGVVFARGEDGHYRLLTDEQYADLFEERGPSS